ncbi:NAD-dependent epimerase [bacterium]|nr:NAD-dependent epimerase [bacterium]
MKRRVLVTGSAGFIGFHISKRLLDDGFEVIGIDNINDYYDVKLKEDRLAVLRRYSDFNFLKIDLSDKDNVRKVFTDEKLCSDDAIIHLAAQAGVRYAMVNPGSYIDSNLIGFFNLLEQARSTEIRHFIFASSSSVYGGNTRQPFSVHDNVDHPISLYAATKKSNELMAHVFAFTYNLPVTGLRFFTVYGPWGRPDMALFIFTKAILAGQPLPVFNYGDMFRDFTYIDDIVEGVVRLIDYFPKPDPHWNGDNPDPGTSWVPYRIYNIGNHKTVKLLDFIRIIEDNLGMKAVLDFKPMQMGDVKASFAEIEDLTKAVGFIPKTSIEQGIPKFIEWYLDYYKVKRQI